MSKYDESDDIKLGRQLHRVMEDDRKNGHAGRIAAVFFGVVLFIIAISSCLYMSGVRP